MAVLTSVKSGRWSDPTTWDLGQVPAAGDQVVIAPGHTVIYDVIEGSANDVVLGTSGTSTDIDIRGTLQFDTAATQPLRLQFRGFILIRSTGKLLVGTEDIPLPVRATIYKITTGNMGVFRFENNATVSFVGSPDLPYDPDLGHYRYLTTLASAASSGATQITVNHNLNWQVGDYIIMPRLWSEIVFSLAEPFVAQVTGVSGTTLTLSSGLPHAYPAGAWVAKINRPITLIHNISDLATNWFVPTSSGNVVNVIGLKWCWARKVGGRSHNFLSHTNWQGSKIEYVTMPSPPMEPIASIFIGFYRGTRPIQIEHFIGRLFFHDIPVPITVSKGIITQLRCEFSYPAVIDGAHVWNVPSSWMTYKVQFKNCILFSFAPGGGAMFFDNCDFWGIVHWSSYVEPYYYGQVQPRLTSFTCKNCRFRNYSSLGYTSTVRNRFDWSARQHVYYNNYIDCEFYDTWVEPSSFFDPYMPHLSKVRFVNKKVGDTIIKEQEFQPGGVITTTDGLLPPDAPLKAAYSYRFEPKNSNLPLVYQFSLNENDNLVEVWSYVDTSRYPIPSDRRVEIVPQPYEFQPEPWGSDIPRLGFAPIPAANLQWQKVALFAPYTWEKAVGQVLVRGSSGAIWLIWRSRRISLSLFNPYLFVDASTKSVYTNVADMTIYLSALPLSQPTKVLAQFLNVGQAINSAALWIRQFGSTSVIASVSGLPSGSVWVFDITDSVIDQLAPQTYYAAEFVLTLADNSTLVLPQPAMVVFRD